jgi:molybdate transport system ATP-binding protein
VASERCCRVLGRGVAGAAVTLRIQATVSRGDITLDVDLAIAAGEVAVVAGPNGAGKSTLVRAISGLERIDTGSITFDSAVWDAVETSGTGGGTTFVPTQGRRVGCLFQDYRLFEHLSVVENIAFGLRARGIRRNDAEAAATTWLERIGLSGLGARAAGSLSGGQAQRVALARALAVDPSVLLLDEPLAALDADRRTETRNLLVQLLADRTATDQSDQGRGNRSSPCILVTHDPADARAFPRRLVILENGRITHDAPFEQVAANPSTDYARAFTRNDSGGGVGHAV